MIREFFEAKWPNMLQWRRIELVAMKTGISSRSVENWFNGGHMPSGPSRALLLKAYPEIKEVLS